MLQSELSMPNVLLNYSIYLSAVGGIPLFPHYDDNESLII